MKCIKEVKKVKEERKDIDINDIKSNSIYEIIDKFGNVYLAFTNQIKKNDYVTLISVGDSRMYCNKIKDLEKMAILKDVTNEIEISYKGV